MSLFFPSHTSKYFNQVHISAAPPEVFAQKWKNHLSGARFIAVGGNKSPTGVPLIFTLPFGPHGDILGG